MRKIFYLLFLVILMVTLVIRCTKNIGGGGTIETTNGIMGYIQNEDSLPVNDAIVKLIPENYNPVEDDSETLVFLDTTDEKGFYSFTDIPAGKYNIIASELSLSKSFISRNVIVDEKSVNTLINGILKKTASIRVELFMPDTIEKKYVYIPGTDIFSYVKNRSVTLQNIPQGELKEIVLSYGNNKKQNILTNSIILIGGEEIELEWSIWKYKKRIILNTTGEGADIQKDVYNFPLLIRLNNENFDFTKAAINGSDIVFTKENNSILGYEIERWDSEAGKAEIWVLIDTIYGNSSSQSIFIYYGNSERLSSSGKIFDTLNGFQGVWHFGEVNVDTLHDATLNSYNGIPPENNSKPISCEGIIGRCLYFDGIDDFVVMPNTANSKLNFPEKGYYSVYAWVKLDTLDGISRCIVSKGYEQYYLRSTYISPDIKLNTPYWEFVEFSETEKWQATIAPVTETQWALIVGVKEGNRQLLYCNGELKDSTIDIWHNTVSRNTENDLTIGKFAKPITIPINEGYCFFKGQIDEVRIINKAVPPEWIKLSYMNQRMDDKLLIFEK